MQSRYVEADASQFIERYASKGIAEDVALLPEQILHARAQVLDLLLLGIAFDSGGSPFNPRKNRRFQVGGKGEGC